MFYKVRSLVQYLFFASFLLAAIGLVIIGMANHDINAYNNGTLHDFFSREEVYGVRRNGIICLMPTCFLGYLVAFVFPKKIKEFKSRFETFVKNNGGSRFLDTGELTGIAINDNKKLIFLGEKNNIKQYEFSKIRGWEKKVQSAGEVYGSDLKSLGINMTLQEDAKDNTGIFVSVKDIDCPVWHVRLNDTKTIDKWYEILQQHVNEV